MTNPPLVPADHALLERILTEGGVQRAPAPPGWADYMLVVAKALAERIGLGLGPLGRLLEPHSDLLVLAAELFLAAVLGLLLFFLGRGLLRARALRRRRLESGAEVPAASEKADVPFGPEAWSSEVERRLASGDARGALEALWWWLARSLCGPDADPSWTSRELLDRAQRPDLRPFAAAFDRLCYGPEDVRAPDVRQLAGRIRSALA